MNRELVVLVQGLVTLFAGALRGQIRVPRPDSAGAAQDMSGGEDRIPGCSSPRPCPRGSRRPAAGGAGGHLRRAWRASPIWGWKRKMLTGAFAAAAIAAVTGSALLRPGSWRSWPGSCCRCCMGYATVSRQGNQVVSGHGDQPHRRRPRSRPWPMRCSPLGGQTPPLAGAARLIGHPWPFAAGAADGGLPGTHLCDRGQRP